MTDKDIWEYWRNALAGENQPVHEGDPQVGFYRKRNKPYNGKLRADDPVAIYYDGNELIALVGTVARNAVKDPAEIWTWVCQNPVAYEDYQAAFNNGSWEQEIKDLEPVEAAGGVGHNQAPEDPFETFKTQIEAAAKLADEALSVDTETDEQSNTLTNLKDRLLQLGKDGDKARKAEKKPHDDAGKAVQAKWNPLLEKADKTKKKILARITDYLKRKEQQAAKEAFERAKKAEANGEEIPVLETKRAQTGGKVSGRKTSLRTHKKGVVTDPKAFAAWLVEANNPDIMETLQTCANRIATNGAEAPGVDVQTVRTAA